MTWNGEDPGQLGFESIGLKVLDYYFQFTAHSVIKTSQAMHHHSKENYFSRP